MTTMDILTFVLSLIGALAWIPSIVDFFKKERIEIKLDKQINIVVDQNNSTIGIRLGISCKNKDVFVEKATLEIVHENGHKKNYIWGFIAEVLWENKGDNGNFTTQKQSYALGWKFTKDTISDPGITFLDQDYEKKCKSYKEQLISKVSAIIDNKQDLNAIKTDSNYVGLLQLYKENCQWLSGKYNGTIRIHTVDNNTYENSFSFSLNKLKMDYFKVEVYDILVERTEETFVRGNEIPAENYMERKLSPTFVNIFTD